MIISIDIPDAEYVLLERGCEAWFPFTPKDLKANVEHYFALMAADVISRILIEDANIITDNAIIDGTITKAEIVQALSDKKSDPKLIKEIILTTPLKL